MIKIKIRKYNGMVLGIYILVTSLFLFTLFSLKPLEHVYSDAYTHMAAMHHLSGDPFFSNGVTSPYYGPYLLALTLVSKLFNLGIPSTYLYIGGVINFIILLIGFYSFAKTFWGEKSKSYYLLPIFIILLWGPKVKIFSGDFSLGFLIFGASYPSTFSIAFLLLGLSICKKYIESKDNFSLFFALLIISFVILLSHITTGVQFFILIFLLSVIYLIKSKKYWVRSTLVLLVPLFTVILSIVWPYFSLIGTLIGGTTTLKPEEYPVLFPINSWPSIIGPIFVIGIISLLKYREKFLLSIFAVFFIVALSYKLPIQLASYYKFISLMSVPLFLSFTKLISDKNNLIINKRVNIAVLFILIIIGSISYANHYQFVEKYGFKDKIILERYNFLDNISQDNIILSDPLNSFLIAGLKGFRVIAVPWDHANPDNIPHPLIREKDVESFYALKMSEEEQRDFLEMYKPDYLLLEKYESGKWSQWKILSIKFKTELNTNYEDREYLLINLRTNLSEYKQKE